MVQKRRSPLAQWFVSAVTENLGIKALAVVAAVILFSVVHGAEDAQRSIFVDVVVTPPPASSGKMLVSEIPDEVKVILRGRRALLTGLGRDDVPAVQVDLSDTRRRFYYFDPSAFELPAGISVVSIAPATLQLAWADREERTVRIVPNLVGTLPEGLELRGPPQVQPPSALVRGAHFEVNRLQQATTEPIDLSTLTVGRIAREVPLEPPPEHVAYVGAPEATVVLDVAPRVATRIFASVEIAVMNGPEHVAVRPARVRIEVRGAPGEIEAIDPDSVVPTVDVEGVDPAAGAVSRPVIVRGLGASLDIVRVEPGEVLVDLPVAPRARP